MAYKLFGRDTIEHNEADNDNRKYNPSVKLGPLSSISVDLETIRGRVYARPTGGTYDIHDCCNSRCERVCLGLRKGDR